MPNKIVKGNGHIVQSDWNQTDPKKFDYIHNKPEIPDISDVIKYSAQNLSEAQKNQARINIDAAAIEEFNKSWKDDEIFIFDKETKKFKHSGKTFASFEEEITAKILATMRSEMTAYVADYVENYLSLETIINPDGTIETNSDILFVNGVVTESEENDGSTILYVEEK